MYLLDKYIACTNIWVAYINLSLVHRPSHKKVKQGVAETL